MRNAQPTFLNRVPTEDRTHHPFWWWRASGYLAAIVPFLFLVGSFWTHPELSRHEIADWKPVLALAGASWEKADLYEARHLYLKAGRLASWREDWRGLLAAACGMKKLDNVAGSYFNTHTLLVRAMMAAESSQSRAGIGAVARGFNAIGQHGVALMVSARIGTDWPEESNDSPGLLSVCWQPTLGHN